MLLTITGLIVFVYVLEIDLAKISKYKFWLGVLFFKSHFSRVRLYVTP